MDPNFNKPTSLSNRLAELCLTHPGITFFSYVYESNDISSLVLIDDGKIPFLLLTDDPLKLLSDEDIIYPEALEFATIFTEDTGMTAISAKDFLSENDLTL